ncbi:leucine-rich repeat-containing G protein-coupled receptor 3 isoform X2 [Polyergus mexicanus]|uniref:leucine-rich repeat-containing G protein-coupled receptor 3 isoform X2 n=1 Tax=Polyergus mexicanus TaxID=615972 RepID=UPI0038B569DA
MRYKHIILVGASLITALCILSGLMYYFNQDKCPVGTFLCHKSTICMPQRRWCNGVPDCPFGDDEDTENCFDMHGTWDWFMKDRDWEKLENCDAFDDALDDDKCVYDICHVTCTNYTEIPQNLSPNVTAIFLTENLLTHLSRNALLRYPEIRLLYLDNNDIIELEKGVFLHQTELFWLVLTNNKIREILPGHLTGLNKLETLRLDQNKIVTANFSDLGNSTTVYLIDLNKNMLTESTLKLPQLPTLGEIILDGNRFESITENLFAGCPALKSLSMEDNSITNINENALRNLQQLVELNLAYNRIIMIPSNVFQPVNNLSKLLIGHNPIIELPITLFNPLNNLRSLYFKKFHYCMTYAPKVQKCRPISDGVSSTSHLLSKSLLRAAVWSISCVTCLGNSLVLWGRFTAKDENRVLSIIIRNLAVSDMLMGIYLFIIAIEDARFRDNYQQEASTWMSSWSCTLVGVLAMMSSEVSVLILSFMSVERFILIAAPLKGHRAMTFQAASSSMIVIWIIGFILALMPVIHWRSSTRYYGVNGMCFPLHIDDPYLIGWEYSAFIFLGLNLLGLMIIGYVYAAMFASIWRTRHATPLSVGDSEFALRFFLIVLTDAACWAPIIGLKILAMMNYPVPPDLHAWVVIFILPVNSAINPLLYTFTTPKFRERFNESWFGRMRIYMSRKYSRQNSQVSTCQQKITNKT